MSNKEEILARYSNLGCYILIGVLMLGLSFALAWVSSDFEDTKAWVQFLMVILLGGGSMLAGWLAIRSDKSLEFPKWLVYLFIFAAVIRILAGVFWYVGLPNWGYGSEVEAAGYIMSDAHARDVVSWDLAQSTVPLWHAFTEYRNVDQYGGMLYLSALVYRYLGGDHHLPLLLIVLTASFSSLAVLFTWGFTKRVWGDNVARLAAWILALFPDAILLGSSQMREAFLMTLVAGAIYGLVRYRQDRSWSGLIWVIGGLIPILIFSPPIAGLFLVVIIFLALSIEGTSLFRQPRFWIILGGIALVSVIGIWLAWERIAPEGINNPLGLVSWWFKQSARWQAYFVKRSSPLIRRIFNTTPEWTHLLILMGYGVLQPFLPAAILDQSIPIWKGIAIWRAIGWNLLLPFLLVAPFMLGARRDNKKLAMGITLIVWVGILVASLRSGGDLWDNPRYRVIFVSLQVALVAWVWFEQRRTRNPWLLRMIISLGIILIWFVPWYLQRNGLIYWPITNVFATLGLGILCVAIVFSLIYVGGRMRLKGNQDKQ